MASKVTSLYNTFKRKGLLEDRSEYDTDDLKKAYPELSDKEAKLLYLRLQKWRRNNG